MGKVGNRKVAVTTHLVTDAASLYPANWRLFLPEKTWDPTTPLCQDPAAVAARRARCKVPEHLRHMEKRRLALESFDEIADDWQVRTPPLALADAGYGDNFEFRQGLQDRGLAYVVGVKAGLVAQPADARPAQAPYPGTGRRRTALAYPEPAMTLAELAAATGRNAARVVSWRQGSKQRAGKLRTLRSRFVAIRVRPAGVAALAHHRGGELPECWLLAEWPTDQPAPIQFWLSNLPNDTPPKTMVRWAKLRWHIEHTFRTWKQTLGWTRPRVRTAAHADLWTFLVIAAYTQLRLDRRLSDDLRHPWEKPERADRLTPARVRRGFRRLRPKIAHPARPPKATRPGAGRPKGSKNKNPAPRHPVGKHPKTSNGTATTAPPPP